MYEYTCPNCGKTKKVRYPWEVRTYCSAKCSAVHREEEKRRAVAAINAGECIFHPESVMCGKRDCTNCGWNPVVAKARLGEMGYDPEWKPEPEPETDKFGEWISCDERMPPGQSPSSRIYTDRKSYVLALQGGEVVRDKQCDPFPLDADAAEAGGAR